MVQLLELLGLVIFSLHFHLYKSFFCRLVLRYIHDVQVDISAPWLYHCKGGLPVAPSVSAMPAHSLFDPDSEVRGGQSGSVVWKRILCSFHQEP